MLFLDPDVKYVSKKLQAVPKREQEPNLMHETASDTLKIASPQQVL